MNKKILVAGSVNLPGSRPVVALLEAGAEEMAADLSSERIARRLADAGAGEAAGRVSMVALDVAGESAVIAFFAGLSAADGAVNCTYPRNRRYGIEFPDVKLADFNEKISNPPSFSCSSLPAISRASRSRSRWSTSPPSMARISWSTTG